MNTLYSQKQKNGIQSSSENQKSRNPQTDTQQFAYSSSSQQYQSILPQVAAVPTTTTTAAAISSTRGVVSKMQSSQHLQQQQQQRGGSIYTIGGGNNNGNGNGGICENSHRSTTNVQIEYKVNVCSAQQGPAESHTKINASTNQNGSTAPILQLTSRMNSTIIESSSPQILHCTFNPRLILYILMQLLEKFFFFTLFINGVQLKALQISIGVVYGLASVVKYFIFIYATNTDMTSKCFSLRSSQNTHHKNNSDDGSVVSEKRQERYCVRCEENVEIELYHCDSCKTCVLHPYFHSSTLGACVTTKNKRLIISIVALNVGEITLFTIFTILSINELLSNEIIFKESLIKIFQDASQITLLIIICVMLLMILVCYIVNGYVWRTIRVKTKVLRGKPISTQTTLREQHSKQLGDPRTPTANKQNPIPTPSIKHMQRSGLAKSISGLSQPDQRRFESHWKISPPDGRMDDQQMASLNNSGTIFNHISKKMGSFENLDRITVYSPSKSAKSLNSIDHPSFKKPRNKSQNFSEMDIASRTSPDKVNGIITMQSQYSRKRPTLKSQNSKKQSMPPTKPYSSKDVSDFIPNAMRKSEGYYESNPDYREEQQPIQIRQNVSILSNQSQLQFPSKLQSQFN